MFRSSANVAHAEYHERQKTPGKILRFGIDFLDDALRGIFPDDLILLGAPSGIGKTQLCCNIAHSNILEGKRVHYIALEASEHEIERRLKYPMVQEKFYADKNRPRLVKKLTFANWLMGDFVNELREYEALAAEEFENKFKGLHVLYKTEKFNIRNLVESVLFCSNETDLIIIDHVHYFDFDDDNENRAIKEIAKTVRTLALEEQKPIILVAHLRKRDRHNEELVAGLDEFHGSSDLYKIATKVITLAPGKITPTGEYETFFRLPKNRVDGGVTRYLGREFFSPKKGSYERGKYKIGWAHQTRKEGFAEIDHGLLPDWARPGAPFSNSDSSNARQPYADD